MNSIRYALNPPFTVAQFRAVLEAATLGERRPVHDPVRLGRMLQNAPLLVVAYDDDDDAHGQPVGVARAVTDFAWCCYLSELAVAVPYQRRGIGKALIEQVQVAAGPEAQLLLLHAPAAANYYPHVGFEAVLNAWKLPRQQ